MKKIVDDAVALSKISKVSNEIVEHATLRS